jgi:hypothetical protein
MMQLTISALKPSIHITLTFSRLMEDRSMVTTSVTRMPPSPLPTMALSSEVPDVESERSLARLPFGRIISKHDEDARALEKLQSPLRRGRLGRSLACKFVVNQGKHDVRDIPFAVHCQPTAAFARTRDENTSGESYGNYAISLEVNMSNGRPYL